MTSRPIGVPPSASTGCSTSWRAPAAPSRTIIRPIDIEKLGDDSYRITLAVAGFKREEIEIVAHQNVLTITGRRAEDRNKDGNYLHMGIANRAFERRFELADFVQVSGAELADGLLRIALQREIPEAMKPRKIDIGGAQPATIDAAPAPAEKAAELSDAA